MASMDKVQLVGALYNWTDDLPVCKNSAVGYQTNRNYKAPGSRGEDYEDRSFHFQCPDDCYLYGIIDGHGGFKLPNFVAQKLPAELLLGQLKDGYSDAEVRQKLEEAFENVQKGFVGDLINDSLVEKMTLEEQMPQDMTEEERNRRFPILKQRLQELVDDIEGGCSAVIALIHKAKLYVANVGDARAVLCRVDESSGELGVVQLSEDHIISSDQELRRLDNLGLDIVSVQVSRVLKITRSIGDWKLKGGYKSIKVLSTATEEPVLSTPYVHGGEPLNNSMMFLILMSQGVCATYETATNIIDDPQQVNFDIATMVRDEIMKQTTIEGVSQSVVDQICLLHQNQYYVTSQNQKFVKRDDMTLLVRLFNIEPGMSHPIDTPKKVPNLTPLIMPTPPQRPAKPIYLQSAALERREEDEEEANVGQVTSPLTVTVMGNPNYEEITADDVLIPANVNKEDDSPIPYEQTRSEQQELYDDQPVFRGFTDTDFFYGGGRERIVPQLVPVRQQNFPHDSIRASNDSSNSVDLVDDKTKLFNRPAEPIETDADGRVTAYVDFTEFTTKMNAMGGENFVFSQFRKGSNLT